MNRIDRLVTVGVRKVQQTWNKSERHRLIPGGAHTYSRGDDQFPMNAPELVTRGKGAHIWGHDGRKFIDWGMGLRSVSLGYADRRVDRSAIRALKNGINLSRPTPGEFELASLLVELIPSAEMVKFGKNGSDATAAAIRLARAFTGRDLVLRCAENPFLGVHDWFIGSTDMKAGIPTSTQSMTGVFPYNNVVRLRELMEIHDGEVAAVILEPVGISPPDEGYLEELRRLTTETGSILIFDETITGFRVALGGAQAFYGVTPDLSTFGKGIANGYPLSALVGRSDVMERGGIYHEYQKVFLMSSTYGAERASIAAAKATIENLSSTNAIDGNWNVAGIIMDRLRSLVANSVLSERITITGLDLLPSVAFHERNGMEDAWLKTLFMQEMLNESILMAPYFFSVSASHRQDVVKHTIRALDIVVPKLAKAVESDSVRNLVIGPPVRKVFREFNDNGVAGTW